MRKNVLFIARFDNILKGMNKILARSFNMQMCPPEPAMIEKMIGVVEIDLILLYISGLSEKILTGICKKLEAEHLQVPVIVFGTADECLEFYTYCPITINKYMYRPLAAQDVAKAIGEILEVTPEDSTEKADETPAEKPAEKPAESSKEESQQEIDANISLADLAASLEVDRRRCILLVDDDGRILRAMKMLLEKNYRINLANSGTSALESIERDRPDAVLLDYEMPMFDGRQTLEMIRRNKGTQDLPVFFLTGVSDKERIKNVIHLRPQGYLLKTSEQSAIIGTLEKFFNDAGD